MSITPHARSDLAYPAPRPETFAPTQGAFWRERLLTRIHRRIERWPERHVRKTYLAMFYVAQCV